MYINPFISITTQPIYMIICNLQINYTWLNYGLMKYYLRSEISTLFAYYLRIICVLFACFVIFYLRIIYALFGIICVWFGMFCVLFGMFCVLFVIICVLFAYY